MAHPVYLKELAFAQSILQNVPVLYPELLTSRGLLWAVLVPVLRSGSRVQVPEGWAAETGPWNLERSYSTGQSPAAAERGLWQAKALQSRDRCLGTSFPFGS